MATDSFGNIFIADRGNHRIRKIDVSTGFISSIAVGLTLPSRLAVDASNDILMLDANQVRKISASSGIINTVAGNGENGFSGDDGPAVQAVFRGPTGLSTDGQGNLYITDTLNLRIRAVR